MNFHQNTLLTRPCVTETEPINAQEPQEDAEEQGREEVMSLVLDAREARFQEPFVPEARDPWQRLTLPRSVLDLLVPVAAPLRQSTKADLLTSVAM